MAKDPAKKPQARKKLRLSVPLEMKIANKENGTVEFERSTLLVPGVHNGITFPREEIEKMKFEQSFPLNLDHSQDVSAEVGFWTDAAVEGEKFRANPVINKETAYAIHALGYINNRQKFGAVPEVSVEVYGVPKKDAEGNEIFTELEIDKASLVSRGAVSPEKGAGIGMADGNVKFVLDNSTNSQNVTVAIQQKDGTLVPVDSFTCPSDPGTWTFDDGTSTGSDTYIIGDCISFPAFPHPGVGDGEDNDNEKPVEEKSKRKPLGMTPKNPSGYGTSREKWSKPSLGDFTDKSWDDLSDAEKKKIASHFAWTKSNPPENTADLKLPHHNPKSHNVVWRGVTAAMAALSGARGGVDVPAGDKGAIYSHLAAHYKDFDEEPPAKDDVLSEKENDKESESTDGAVTHYITECYECGLIFNSARDPEEEEVKCPTCGGPTHILRSDNPPTDIPTEEEIREQKTAHRRMAINVKIDSKELEKIADELSERLAKIEGKIHAIEEVIDSLVSTQVKPVDKKSKAARKTAVGNGGADGDTPLDLKNKIIERIRQAR